MPLFRAPRPALACVAALLIVTPAAAIAADYPTYPTTPSTPTSPNYPDYPNYPTTPTTPTSCPTGQVGTPPNCQPVVDPPAPEEPQPEQPKPEQPKPEQPKPEQPKPADPAPPSPAPGPSPISSPAPKPTLAFKGKVKATKKGQFSVACVVKNPPAGASCRLRVIVGGKALATVTEKVQGDSARLRISLKAKQLKKVPKNRQVRVALDLVDAKGNPTLSTRQTVTLPKK